jgi:hypothetical protein
VCSYHAQQLRQPISCNAYLRNSKPDIVAGATGAVYVLRAGTSPYFKIGQTRYPRPRIQQLQVGNHHNLCCEFLFISDDYRINEGLVHNHLTATDRHIRAEWFTLDDNCDYKALFTAAGVDMSKGRVGEIDENGHPVIIRCDPNHTGQMVLVADTEDNHVVG